MKMSPPQRGLQVLPNKSKLLGITTATHTTSIIQPISSLIHLSTYHYLMQFVSVNGVQSWLILI